MTVEPLIPSSLWLALAVAGMALWVWYARSRPAGISQSRWVGAVGLMSIGILAALIILLNPTMVRPVAPPPGRPLLTILVDESGSMATPDVAAGGTRYRAAGDLAGDVARRLSGEFDVRLKGFAGTTSARSIAELASRKPEGSGTNVAGAIGGSIDEERPAGQAILLLSDGIHNSGGSVGDVLDAVRLARANGAPIFTRTFGGEGRGWDLAVELRSPQDLSFVKQKVPLTVRVKYTGLSAVKTNVLLLADGKEISRREVAVLPGGAADVHFLVSQEKVGLYTYEVRAEPLAGEGTQSNNSASYLLRVVDEPIRVLVLEGKPYWDSKFLLRTLTADPAVALDSVVKLSDRPVRLLQRTMARVSKEGTQEMRAETEKILNDAKDVLGSVDRLKGYQIVLLGRDAEAFLSDAAVANLQNWISQEGGSLVCYRGASSAAVNQKLGKLMPVKWGASSEREARFRVKLTEQGQDLLPAGTTSPGEMLPRMPALTRSMPVEGSKPLAVVLATAVGAAGEEVPAVVYQPYGAGKVVVLEGGGMWRWAFLPPAYQQQEEVYAALWHSLLRWLVSGANLMPGQRMTLRSDKVTFNADEEATATLLVREGKGEIPKVELAAIGAKEVTAFAPTALGEETGSYRVNFGKLGEGRYEVKVAGAKEEEPALRAMFDVKVFGAEQLNLAARPDLMGRIAADSGGAVLGQNAAEEVSRRFREHVGRAVSQRVEKSSAWDRWWVLAGVMGLWTLTWAIRRSGGLV